MYDPIQLKEYLYSKNIKPSNQRIKIFEHLANNRSHPTVDEIYLALVKEMPTLSKTTVYNTLKLFVDNKLAKLISIEDTESRYDASVQPHGHFKCLHCGNIYDFPVDLDELISDELQGFSIEEKHIYFKGICKSCLTNIKL